MIYREPLPEDCPPDEAEEITAPRVVYRLVRNNPPTGDDFLSQRAEKAEPDIPRRYRVSGSRGIGVRQPQRRRKAVNKWKPERNHSL